MIDQRIPLDGDRLTIEEVIAVAKRNARVKIAKDAEKKLRQTSNELITYVEDILGRLDKSEEIETANDRETGNKLLLKQKMMYGTTTGFGDLKTKRITNRAMAKLLQRNIILSHSSGVGPIFDQETTRAIMLLRANILTLGYSGVRPKVLQQIINMLNNDIYPEIPEQGSVGASGDLAPLSHLALGLIGEGPVRLCKGKNAKRFGSLKKLLQSHPEVKGVEESLELSYKEGLALVNGITAMTGVAVLAYTDALNLVEWADVLGAATLEGILGCSRAFDEIVFTVYRHQGAGVSAKRVREMITGSDLINRSTDVHDPYSVRCIPQVHGAVRDALGYVKTTIENQMKSVDDDPIIFSNEEINKRLPMDFKNPPKDSDGRKSDREKWKNRKHFEQGNFHGEPLAFAMDLLAIVTAELGSISERRTQMLLDGHHNRGLPPCLVDNPKGVNSGYMIAQYVAASLVSENKGLCHPASVDSIPTSANTEDHVSMGTIAARKARKVIENVRTILAIELLCSTEALSYRLKEQRVSEPKAEAKERRELITGDRCGVGTTRLYESVRKGRNQIKLLRRRDVVLHKLINRARDVVRRSPVEIVGE